MKLPLTLKYLFYLLLIIAFVSCKKDNAQEKQLRQAQNSLVIGKYDVALNLLASIQNPGKMNTGNYMQYIVTYVGAKYETKADITDDTLIFEAQRYFNEKENSEYTPLANYYAAQWYDENGNFPKALESYMHAVYAADKSNNYLLGGKSLNNIGYIYFEQNLFDSSIVNYRKALSYYNKVENVDQSKLKTLTNIGRSFEVINKLDSAYIYFNKALDKALETNNEVYQFHSLKNLGVVCYGMENYDKAIDYFQSALNMDVKSEVDQLETSKIYFLLLKINNKKGDRNSAKKYADLVTISLPKVAYKYTTKEIYAALSEYFEQAGDYKQALKYRNLEKTTKEQIEQEANVPALLDADKSFYLAQKEREVQEFRSGVILVFIPVASVFCILLVFFLVVWRTHKKDQEEIQFYADKYEEMRQVLISQHDEYPKLEAEIKSMLEDD